MGSGREPDILASGRTCCGSVVGSDTGWAGIQVAGLHGWGCGSFSLVTLAFSFLRFVLLELALPEATTSAWEFSTFSMEFFNKFMIRFLSPAISSQNSDPERIINSIEKADILNLILKTQSSETKTTLSGCLA